MRPNRRWVAYVVGREALLLWFCFLGSWLFVNHGLLYVKPGIQLVNAPPLAYALTTAILYTFIRSISIVLEIRPPRERRARTSERLEDPVPARVRPVRRVVAPADPSGIPPSAALLRNAVASAQGVLPVRPKDGVTPISALPRGDPGEFVVSRLAKVPWRPPWMEDRPRRR